MNRILIAPMDWGLGHATRCVPIIRELLQRKCTVFIAGSGNSLALLKNEFPFLTFFLLQGYDPIYPSNSNMVWMMARQFIKFNKVIKKEHEQVEALINELEIDLVISDNRYGCWSAKIPTVIITHQLNILMPKSLWWLAKVVRSLNERMIKKFSFCWVPDYRDAELSLAGKLATYNENSLKNIAHIGPLSRFCNRNSTERKYDVICIFSGPEPQRSIFEKIVIDQLSVSGLRYFVASGIPLQAVSLGKNEVEFLNSEELQTVISQSSMVIARSGYSMIMDLAALGKKAILIPTPGQTEQEYLAMQMERKESCIHHDSAQF